MIIENRYLEDVKLAQLANGGEKHKADWCECDPSVNMAPCRYCAIFDALQNVRKYLEEKIAAIGCRRCGECVGASHHWQADPHEETDEDVGYDYRCKHCRAIGYECAGCDGDGCPTCNGEGVRFKGLRAVEGE